LWLVLAYFLPGWLLARRLALRSPLLLAFPFSLILLYAVALPFLLSGWPVTPTPVLVGLGVVCALLSRGAPPVERPAAGRPGLWLVPALLMAAALTWRAALLPLSCFDTYFRWEYLARLLLQYGHLDFYPPVSAADYRLYCFPDPIPPMVSVAYWMLYGILGQPVPAATALLVGAQYLNCLLGVREAAARLYGGRGEVAMLALASSGIFYASVVIGQETGLIALSVVAFLLTHESPRGTAPALALALAGVSREYGPAFLLLALHLRPRSRRYWLELLAAWALLVLPWYLRNWVKTGNPLVHTALGLFATNEVFLRPWREGAQAWRAQAAHFGLWLGYAGHLLTGAGGLGLLAALGAWRSGARPRVLPAAVVLATAFWLASTPYTQSGQWAARVLAPGLVCLAVLAGRLQSRWALGLAALACLAALPAGLLYPTPPGTLPVEHWTGAARYQVEFGPRYLFPLRDALLADQPGGRRVLTSNQFMTPLLHGTGSGAVIAWSPEVQWIQDPNLPPEAVRQGLLKQGIGYVQTYVQGETLGRTPFFQEGRAGAWTLVYRDRGIVLYRL